MFTFTVRGTPLDVKTRHQILTPKVDPALKSLIDKLHDRD